MGLNMKKKTNSALTIAPEYRRFIEDLKARVISARICAARAVNSELILLYWDIGRVVVEKQRVLGWGESVIDRVSADLQEAFPDTTGFSPRNLRDMKRFYLAYADEAIWRQLVAKLAVRAEADDGEIWRQAVAKLQKRDAGTFTGFLPQLLAEIPWGHNLLILNKLTDPAARIYYLRATARFGWSRNVLLNQIKAGAYESAVAEKKSHNFPLALPEYLVEQADEMLKSSYNLEFLGIRREIKERELEDRLMSRLQAFLLELGYGFCFVGRQHRLALKGKEYFIDLLFYHRFLKALVAL
jgi:predicted nuclease of restriction endonuclease-like (RecB) superfamily